MNDAVGDQGPINPWNSARTRHVCRFLKLRAAVTLNEEVFISPESCILVPVSPYTSKRYCSGPNVGSNFGVAGDAVSVGCVSLICASLMGDVGAGDCRLQANVSARAARAAVTANRDPFIRRLLLVKGANVMGML